MTLADIPPPRGVIMYSPLASDPLVLILVGSPDPRVDFCGAISPDLSLVGSCGSVVLIVSCEILQFQCPDPLIMVLWFQ
jgi:hypothetical protein